MPFTDLYFVLLVAFSSLLTFSVFFPFFPCRCSLSPSCVTLFIWGLFHISLLHLSHPAFSQPPPPYFRSFVFRCLAFSRLQPRFFFISLQHLHFSLQNILNKQKEECKSTKSRDTGRFLNGRSLKISLTWYSFTWHRHLWQSLHKFVF